MDDSREKISAEAENEAAQRRFKPSREEIAAAAGKTVPDLIAPDLKVLFCGINPGLYSGVVRHHFARPGNRFWRAIHEAGFTEKRLAPEEEAQFLALGYGITNLVERASLAADELSKEELKAGAERLEAMVRRLRPKWVCFLGIGAYRTAFSRPKAAFGLQPQTLADALVWVLPNPSGLNAHFTPKGLSQIFGEFWLALETENGCPQ